VPRDDLKAYHYFNQLVEDYDEDDPDRRNLSAISKAFVAVGVYCLNGIPNSEVRPDPERAHELFQYAATTFGDADAQYNLAHMYIVGAAGLAKDNRVAVRWLALAAEKGHRPSQAVLGHLLFNGEGVPNQRARGLMWLQIARNNDQDPKDEWIRELTQRDLAAASDEDRQMAAMLLDRRSKGPPLPPMVTRSVLKAPLAPRPPALPTLVAAPPPLAPPLPLAPE
jgi:TPR repeat protein